MSFQFKKNSLIVIAFMCFCTPSLARIESVKLTVKNSHPVVDFNGFASKNGPTDIGDCNLSSSSRRGFCVVNNAKGVYLVLNFKNKVIGKSCSLIFDGQTMDVPSISHDCDLKPTEFVHQFDMISEKKGSLRVTLN